MQNLQMIEIKYLSPTDTKGARVKLIDTRFKVNKTLSYDYEIGDITEQSVQYLKNKGFNVIFKSYDELNNKQYIFLDNFEGINQTLISVK